MLGTMTALHPPAPARPRIAGIDMARALAILGMVMVHFGPFSPDTSTVSGQVYRLSYGRASVLFVLLAGVGVSLLFRARPPADARVQIAWRALVFFPLGVLLQSLPTPVAVILQFYALYYLLGGLVATLSTRALAALTLVWTVLGPVAFLTLQDPALAGRGTASTLSDPTTVVADLLLTGFYPLVTWAPPLLVGLLVGRADLRDRVTCWILTLGGTGIAVAAYGGSELVRAAAPATVAGSSWLLAVGHTGAPLNVLGATGIAVAVLGLCLLLAAAAPRPTWPLVAVGQMALTVYVGHLLVMAVVPTWLEARGSVDAAWVSVARFYVVTTVVCLAWRARFARGPLEALLGLPFSRRRVAGPTAPPLVETQATPLGPHHHTTGHRDG